jgi:hypothetical protein
MSSRPAARAAGKAALVVASAAWVRIVAAGIGLGADAAFAVRVKSAAINVIAANTIRTRAALLLGRTALVVIPSITIAVITTSLCSGGYEAITQHKKKSDKDRVVHSYDLC